MSVFLDVPYISQMNIGHHGFGGGYNDPFGCWYASICMIGYYFERGPRQGLPELHTGTWSDADRKNINENVTEVRSVLAGLSPEGGHVVVGRSVRTTKVFDELSKGPDRAYLAEFKGPDRAYKLLCKREHLEPVPGCASTTPFTLSQLESLLKSHGPICFGWQKPVTGGHMSVLIGTDEELDDVLYHDPGTDPNGHWAESFSRMRLSDFNQRRVTHEYALLRRCK
jgi:hypothetical protein